MAVRAACSTSRNISTSRRCGSRRPETLEGSGEGAHAGAAQCHERLAHLPAQALHENGGLVADAIDREHHQVGAADEAAQQAAAIVDAAVMVQKTSTQPFAGLAQMADFVGPPA